MNAAGTGWSLPLLDGYAEAADRPEHWLDGIETVLSRVPGTIAGQLHRRRLRRLVTGVNAAEPDMRKLSDEELNRCIRDLRIRMRRVATSDRNVRLCFAVVREVARRTIGLRPLDVQIFGGLAMLHGSVAEMDTGEGKTLTAALTASAAALAGKPVHVVTINEYLAARDLEILRPIYDRLGLTSGVITQDLARSGRVAVYAKDIVYASNKEIAFDYLRDRIALGGQPRALHLKLRRLSEDGAVDDHPAVMRGLHFAIVDEADSVLVDEARTPLIISQETDAGDERQWVDQAFRMIEGFEEGVHYRRIQEERRIELTEAAEAKLSERGEVAAGIWLNPIRREEAARQSLSALLLFNKGEHYLVRDGKVQIVDEYSGRVMADRSWSDGLHQMIERKEGCEVTGRKLTVARMTYQRFFRRYLHLAGMTGTAREIRSELRFVYGARVMRIPPNVPSLRRKQPTIICATLAQKWRTVVARTEALKASGRPVLIGTRSVAASETVSGHLQAAGIGHTVLNAEQSSDEANIIRRAGELGRVTVATNMAGRGVDIAVDPRALELGGLHVLLSERHDAGRIDRQLEGRTARKGEPGSTEAILSLEDPLIELVPIKVLRMLGRRTGRLGRTSGLLLFRLAQRRAECSHAKDRKNLLAQDRRLGVLLAFSGRPE